jgi:hypothetical protein
VRGPEGSRSCSALIAVFSLSVRFQHLLGVGGVRAERLIATVVSIGRWSEPVKSSMTSQLRIWGASLLVHRAMSRVDRWFPFSLVIVPGGSSRWSCCEKMRSQIGSAPACARCTLSPPQRGWWRLKSPRTRCSPGASSAFQRLRRRVFHSCAVKLGGHSL